MYLTSLATVLRSAGVKVVEVPGWKSRGRGPMSGIKGILIHHTATPSSAKGNYPSLRIVRDGRSDLPGPLAQLGLGRDGTWYVIAAGRANHSGRVDSMSYSNPYAIGIEAEHSGRGAWPKVQYDSYVKGVRALWRHYKTAVPRGHKEAAVPYGRKPDPNFSMSQFRRDVANGSYAGVAADQLAPVTPKFKGAITQDGFWGPATAAAFRKVLGRTDKATSNKDYWRDVARDLKVPESQVTGVPNPTVVRAMENWAGRTKKDGKMQLTGQYDADVWRLQKVINDQLQKLSGS